jgi:hypothetical protein
MTGHERGAWELNTTQKQRHREERGYGEHTRLCVSVPLCLRVGRVPDARAIARPSSGSSVAAAHPAVRDPLARLLGGELAERVQVVSPQARDRAQDRRGERFPSVRGTPSSPPSVSPEHPWRGHGAGVGDDPPR